MIELRVNDRAVTPSILAAHGAHQLAARLAALTQGVAHAAAAMPLAFALHDWFPEDTVSVHAPGRPATILEPAHTTTRRYDAKGRPLCFECNLPQSAHPDGNECEPAHARPSR